MSEGLLSFLGASNVDSGVLTEEDFLKARAAIMRMPAKPSVPIYHPKTVTLGREVAVGAAATARWLWHLAEQLPWWAWARRRRYRVEGIERASFAETMWATFGTGEESL